MAAVCVVLDPGLVVLGGEVGRAGRHAGRPGRGRGGPDLPGPPQVVPTAVAGAPVLRGAILAAVEQARAELLDSVASPQPAAPIEIPAI